MNKKYVIGLLICTGLFSFNVSENKFISKDMVGSWQFFEIGNSDNAADIQFQFQGNAEFKVISGNEKNPIVTGTWNLAKESVLVASEPFVEQDEYVLQLNIQSKTVAFELPEEMRLIQIRKSRILMHYVQGKRGHKIRLTRVLAN